MCGRVGFCFCHVLGSSCWCWYLILASATFPWLDHLLRDTICCKICSKGEKLFLSKQEGYWTFLRYHTPLFFLLSASSLRTFICPSFPQWFFGSGACLCKSCSSDGKSDWEISRDRVLVTAALEGWHPPPPLPPFPPQKFSVVEYPSVVAVVTSSFTLAVPRSTFASRELPCRFSLWCYLLVCMPFSPSVMPWPPRLYPELDSGQADTTDEKHGAESWVLISFSIFLNKIEKIIYVIPCSHVWSKPCLSGPGWGWGSESILFSSSEMGYGVRHVGLRSLC